MIYRALPQYPCFELASVEHPGTVVDIHSRFIAAGAQIVETNTFGANRYKLRAHGLEERVREINGASVKLAREAREISGREVYVAGSIGPTGLHLDPLHHDNEERRKLLDAFREQAEALDERGVDLFIAETFTSVYECLVAIEAIRSISRQPILASLTFPDEWSPMMGTAHAQLFAALVSAGVDAVGLNCSMGPAHVLEILEGMGPFLVGPLCVQPNAGVPTTRGGRFAYPHSSPEYFAEFAREAVRLGARIVGGCCGTGPEHIEAIAAAVSKMEPSSKPAAAPVATPAPAPPVRSEERLSPFARKLAEGKFVRVVQLDPPKGTNAELCLSSVDRFLASKRVDAVDVNSNPMARLHMDSLWLSEEIERRGMETIPHITPRDASLMGLEGALLGAWRGGIRNVLVITGDPSQIGNMPGASDVYQTDGVGLVKVVAELNGGFDWVGNPVGDPPSFCIGVAVNPNADDLDREIDRFREKVDNGAHFAMTQVFFEWSCWERFLDRFGGKLPIPALVAIWPLTSYRLAVRLDNEVPGIVVPVEIQKGLELAGNDARSYGFDLARRLYWESGDRSSGVYVIAPFKNPAAALEILD
jgi:homocysteine S-methyltransferase